MSNLPNNPEQEDAELLQRLDARLAELKALKAHHAFSVERLEGTGAADFKWTCLCGTTIIQLEGDTDIQQRLVAHASGIQQ